MNYKDDWRLFRNQINYLYQAHLSYHQYVPSSPGNDHDHCEFCMDKFGVDDSNLHVGYSTQNGAIWICEKCYQDFAKMFHWTVDEN